MADEWHHREVEKRDLSRKGKQELLNDTSSFTLAQDSKSLAAKQHHQMQVHTSHNVLCIHGVCFITGGCMLFISRR